MGDLVLLTGISGFLGGHVALELLNAGYRVRGSLRSLSRADQVKATLERAGADTSQLEFVALDLTRDDGWHEAMQGVRYLQHVASPFVLEMPKDKMDLIRPAVEGTERAITAALASDVERIVLTSSVAAIIYGHAKSRSTPFTSADWSNLDTGTHTFYVESKTLAERRAWELMEQAGRRSDLAVINPAGIFGPLLDNDPGTSPLIIQRLLNGGLPAAINVNLGIVDARDVAAAHRAAMEQSEAGGRRFPASVKTLSLKQMSEATGQATPQYAGRMPKFTAPDWLVRIMALFDKSVRDNTKELGFNRLIDPTEVEALLGRKLIGAEEAIAETAQTLVAQGLVKP